MTTETSFAAFELKPFIQRALADLKFNKPTPVQQKVIPVILAGKSVVGQSATGSGKTHAFLLPIFNQLDPRCQQVQVVIATPSRELAYQIYNAAKQINQFSSHPFIVHNYVGGTDKQRQLQQLRKSQPQMVIGTPGRILDMAQSGALDIHTAKQLVIDEADMTLDMGFLPTVDQIAGRMPTDLQMMVFSATIPEQLQPFLKKYMANPVVEKIPVATVINPNVDNWLINTKGRDRNQLIYQLLTMGEPYLALVFANTRERANELARYLQSQGLDTALIHGGLQPRQRKRVMRQVHHLDYQYVVATDLAARGIDIDGVSLVINDDLPEDLEYFVHRVGRTGRNGLHGTAITLYQPAEDQLIEQLEKRGIHFHPKTIRGGRVVDSYDRNRRSKRKRRHEKLDPTMIGFVKKTKRKVKPGYKKRIRKAIADDREYKWRKQKQHEERHARRQRQRKYRRERELRRRENQD